jgi:Zn-dependent protease
MTEKSANSSEPPVILQADFEQTTRIVSAQFQTDDAFLEHGIPTYYLKQPQETKEAFLKVLKGLEPMKLIPILRKEESKIVLRAIPKPPVKPSNTLINWILLLATVGTTFITGYMMSPEVINPIVGGASFTAAMLAVLGTHEMGHKITANKKGIDATLPYFIPGPPPFGTFGAVIMQKSLPPNKDSLFDIGADGPIAGFIIATIVSIIGLTLLVPSAPSEGLTPLSTPLIWTFLAQLMQRLNLMPQAATGEVLLVHPIAFAGWVGMIVTMLNLLPAAMLDGGHVARSILGEKQRLVLSALSVIFLFIEGFYPMAFLVLLMSMYKHPGPLDDVSSLSKGRKLIAIGLIAIFVLCIFPTLQVFG